MTYLGQNYLINKLCCHYLVWLREIVAKNYLKTMITKNCVRVIFLYKSEPRVYDACAFASRLTPHA